MDLNKFLRKIKGIYQNGISNHEIWPGFCFTKRGTLKCDLPENLQVVTGDKGMICSSFRHFHWAGKLARDSLTVSGSSCGGREDTK